MVKKHDIKNIILNSFFSLKYQQFNSIFANNIIPYKKVINSIS